MTRVGASVLGLGFGALATLRRSKPVHPKGVVYDVRLERFGSGVRSGVAWLDAPGGEDGLVRFSRSVGLPAPLPDLLGMALRMETASGHYDLLLATTGTGPGVRHVLVPRRHMFDATYTSLMPYDACGRSVFLAAKPVQASSTSDDQTMRIRTFDLLVAEATTAWEVFGRLTVRPRAGGASDRSISFDPVQAPPPGLRFWPLVAPIRSAAYEAARRGDPSRA